MKKLLTFILGLTLLPSLALAQLNVVQGGTGLSAVTQNFVLLGNSQLHLQAVATSSLGLENPLIFNSPLSRTLNTVSFLFNINNIWTGQNQFNASTTLQNFTFINATGTSATTTALATGTLCLTADTCRTTWPSTSGFLTAYDAFTHPLAGTSATTSNIQITGSSTLQSFTFTIATGTSATTTNFFATTASTTNLFGSLIQGFGLVSCIGTNALTYSGGSFSCTAQPQGTVTNVTGTTNRITSSGGATPAIDISASYVGQGSITTVGTLSSGAVPASLITSGTFGSGNYIFPAQLQINSSSTLQNFTGINSTTTNATTTTLAITGTAKNCNGTSAITTDSNGVVTCTAQPQGTVTAVSVVTANGVSGSSSGGATPALTITLGAITPSSVTASGLGTFGTLLVSGSTTLQNFTGLQATTTNATSTNFFSTTASTTNLFFTTATGGNLTSVGLATFSNFLANASSTFQNFTFRNATGTAATTTTLYVSSDSILAATGGRVGIATTTPLELLSVAGGNILQTPGAPVYKGGVDVTGSVVGTGNLGIVQTVIVGRYLYAVTNASSGNTCGSGAGNALGCTLQIYDVSTTTPVFLGGASSGGATNSGNGNTAFNDIAVKGNYAYVVMSASTTACSITADTGAGNGCELKIFDVSNPTAPTYVGGADANGSTNSGSVGLGMVGIRVQGRYAYIASSGSGGNCTLAIATGCELKIFDISSSTNPIYVGGGDASGVPDGSGGTTNSTFNELDVLGKYAYIAKVGVGGTACSNVPGSASGCQLQEWDISNPYSPIYTGGVASNGLATGNSPTDLNYISAQGRFAYVTLAASTTACSAIPAIGGDGCEVQIYDISNPTTPTFVAGLDASGSTNAGTQGVNTMWLAPTGRYLYVAQNANTTACSQVAGSAVGCEVKTFDISDPSAPYYLGGVDIGGSPTGNKSGNANSVQVSGRNLYVTSSNDATTCSQTAGSALGCEIKIFDTLGADVAGLVAGSIEAGNLQVDTGLTVVGAGNLGALNVGGGGIYTNGSLGVYLASTTASTRVSASFMGGNVGIGTTNPAALLDVFGLASSTNLFVNSSTTLQNFTALQSTSTNATSTNFYASNDASTTNFYGANLLSTCNGSGNKLTYTTGGKFLCETDITSIPNSKWATSTDNSSISPNFATKVGVGTTSPWATFSVSTTTQNSSSSPLLAVGSTTNAILFAVFGDGSIGIGTTTPNATLSVNPVTGATRNQFAVGSSTGESFLINNTGNVFAPKTLSSSGAQTGYWCYDGAGQLIRDSVVCIAVSALRFKQNIEPLNVGLDEVLKLRPISYQLKPDYNTLFKDNPNYNGVQYSLVADDVMKIDPHLVTVEISTTTFEGKTYPVGTVHGLADLNNWIGLFVKSFQDVWTKVTQHEDRITKLEKENAELQARVSALEKLK